METMVCFQSNGTAYCVPLHSTRSVRTTEGLVPLPEPAPGVAGLIPGDPPLTVISPLRSKGGHILVMEVGGKTFGLLVDVVTGICRVAEDELRPAPQGQERSLVSGTFDSGGHLILVADPISLGDRL
jgi:chemotaxis signal transduction protein